MSKKTVIIGATTNPSRYAYFAAERLTNAGHEIVPIGIKKGEVFGEEILDIRKSPQVEDVDTITLYLGARHQPEYYDYILNLNPKRIIFNPGTENPELVKLANTKGIETENACTLVMLGSGVY
jgi:predicted CoA-binding protein